MSLEYLNSFLQEVHLTANTTWSERARQVAVQAHIDQTRRDGSPYVEHPIRVANSLTTEDEKVVAYLHDVVEDTSVTLSMLQRFGFSKEQVEAVDSVTKRPKERYLDFVLRAKANPIGRKVKEADIRDNLRDLKPGSLRDKYELALWILLVESTLSLCP